MNADTPTQDELRKDLPRLNRMVAEVEECVCRRCNNTGSYLRYGEHAWFRQALNGAPKEQPRVECDHSTYDSSKPNAVLYPEFTDSLDECRTFEDAMGEEEFIRYCGIQYDMILARRPRQTSVLPVAYLLADFAKLTPVDRCIARLLVAGRIK